MAHHSPQDYDYSRRYLREDIVDDRDPRYFDNREYSEAVRNRDLVPRADPRDSSVSVEEVRRDFPPPTGRDYVHQDVRRARSAEPGYYQEDYEYRRTYGTRLDTRDDRYSRHGGSHYGDDDRDRKPKHSKSMSKQEKIIAAVAGAALLVGGKELYDRHEAKKEGGTPVQRNALSSAALAGLGAFAAYQGAEFYSKQQARKDQKANYILQRGRDGRLDEYYSDDEADSREKKGHKNFLESALAATGLGAAVKSLTGVGDDRHSDTRSRGGSPGSRSVRSGSGSRAGGGASKKQKVAMASLLAGATEAFRVAKEPGGWRGEKAKRILTAAAGAATVDAAHGADHGKLGLAESVIGGLIGNRLINGSRNDIEEDRRTGRSRSRSRARSKDGRGGVGLAALATAGLGALGAKKAFDRSRSRGDRSRSRGRDRSYDSRSPSRDRSRSRSRSVVDRARDGLAKLGFGSGAMVAADDRRRRNDYDDDDYDDRGSRHSGRRDDDHVYDDPRYRRRGHDSERRNRGASRDPSRDRSRSRDQSRRRGGYTSESDLGDSDEDEKRAKKMRGKQVLTTGLATVATIHAAHGVYKSMEKRKARKEAVKEGLLSPQEAKKLKAKAIMQDAASVGIAAIGIKGALAELKEAREMAHECREWRSEKAQRHEKRLERERRKKLGERKRSSSWSSSAPRNNNGYYGDGEGETYFIDRRYSAVSQLSQPPQRRDSR
ncbi:hypothetical protein TGAM01_v201625 [Trichoderma gamsii]|uniref:DUF3824 domain-containing protein n=1 Tax=Trichoderma gamsii TaxID=398673 RepID=A0A0W7VJ45_9HYPO|nr:hypothetical protein TGAM01_v201625 [Trichoderma gamsii]PNP42990.1 hypothetical protein TGAMA5MH_05738 [Trichoderma gamsii]PON29376.1 hypothetical protein TGAM01_v201625 [Trichoderma gamsii]